MNAIFNGIEKNVIFALAYLTVTEKSHFLPLCIPILSVFNAAPNKFWMGERDLASRAAVSIMVVTSYMGLLSTWHMVSLISYILEM